MPPRIEQSYPRSLDVLDADVSRDTKAYYRSLYPQGLDLTPGSEMHDRLRDIVISRATESERFMQGNHKTWRYIDEMLNVYIEPDEEQRLKSSNDPNRPVNVVIPETYATRETIITYMMAAFGTSELFRYTGQGPEDTYGAIMLERLVDVQMKRSKALLAMHTHWNDGFTYGFGVNAIAWRVKTGKRSVVYPTGITDPFSGFIPTGLERVSEPTTLFEGSELRAIDPYCYLPDPTVPIPCVQDGEYVGWKSVESYVGLRRLEAEIGSIFFNVEYLKNIKNGRSSIYKAKPEGRDKKVNADEERYGGVNKHDLLWMYIDLIPADNDMGGSREPEKWLICLAADQVVIAAGPTNLDHGMFPVAVCAPDHSGHELVPISRLEIMSGGQKIMNFYYNSHITNVLKAINNLLVVDPKIINMPDVRSNSPGKVIRTRPAVWGRGVKDGIEQLQVHDVTQNHITNMMVSRDVFRNATGAVDSLQGLQRTGGERVTGTEFTQTRMSALSRLQNAARIISMQSMYDTALMCAYHTQQFLSIPTYAKIAGRYEQTLRQEYGIMDPSVLVDPFQLNIAFDVEISDGSVLGGEYADQWIQLMQVIQSNPELMQTMDSTRVFLHVARLLKAQNAYDFVRKQPLYQPMVLPDQQIEQQTQAGNIVPMGGGQQSVA